MYAAGCKICCKCMFYLQCSCHNYFTVKACLDALSGHTARGHHWLVAGGHSALQDQLVRTPLCGGSPL